MPGSRVPGLRGWIHEVRYAGLILLTLACWISLSVLESPEPRFSSGPERFGSYGPPDRSADSRVVAIAQSRGIPFELETNHVFLRGTINGFGTFWFLLDSAASASLLSLKAAKALGLALSGPVRTDGAAGAAEGALVTGISLGLPGADLPNLSVPAISLDTIERHSGRSIDVILGYELFSRYVVEIDYAARSVSLFDPNKYQYNGSGEIIPLTFSEHHPHVRATIETPGQRPITDEFVIDVGSGYSVLLQRELIERQRQLQSMREAIRTQVTGVGGSIPVAVTRLSRLQIGRFTIQKPVTIYPRTREGTFAVNGKAGNIGNGILKRFKVTFDYAHSRMILEPNSEFQVRDEYDMSGMRLVTEGPNFQLVRIVDILDDSPSQAAGLKVGDLITGLDGRPIGDLGLSKLREMLKEDSRTYDLNVKRADKTLTVRLRTKRLV